MAFARQKEEPLEPLDLGREISELQGLLRMALPAQVRLEVLLPKEPLWILSAPGHLEQILMNLVINARDALPRGGMVRVRVALEGSPGAEAACVSVEDTGTGMSQEVLDQLFTPFFTTKGVGKGTGLGLASVKTLVERNGGTIHVQSAPETGTTFRLCFPVTPAMAGVGTDG
jgi:signal transduction histidine kinase